MSLDYTRSFAAADSVTVRNNSNEWNITRSEEVLQLWLRLPDETGVEPALMEYDWDTDTWSVV